MASSGSSGSGSAGTYNLLVIAAQRLNYYQLFEGATVGGRRVRVEQASWQQLAVCSYADNGGLVVSLAASPRPLPGSPQGQSRSFNPDFVLLRATTVGDARTDYSHLLAALLHSNVPSINNLESFYFSQNKAAMYGRLVAVKRRLGGFKAFPLIAQAAYSDWTAATFPPDVPTVAKVGTASGGLGKARLESAAAWEDFCSVAAMQPSYFTSEPFVPWRWDIRVQKIGNHYRAFRRSSKHWKSNVDMNTKDEDIEVEPRWRVWIDEAAAACRMDICAMDVLVAEADGQEYILELNSSAIGLNGRHHDEDTMYIRELVLMRMEQELAKRNERRAAAAAEPHETEANDAVASTGTSEGEGEPTAVATSETPVASVEVLQEQVVAMQSELQHLYARLREYESKAVADEATVSTTKKARSWLRR